MKTLSSHGKIWGIVPIYTKKRNEKLKDNWKIQLKNWEGEQRDKNEKYFRGL